MLNFVIEKEELERALNVLNKVGKNGFIASQAIFAIKKVGDCLDECVAELDDKLYGSGVILKAHPTDGHKNWGRVTRPEDYVLRDGKCELIDEI